MVAAPTRDAVDGLAGFFRSIGPGEVRSLVVDPIADGVAQLRAYAGASGRVTVAHSWQRLPDVHTAVDEIVEALARAALDLWPDWYRCAPRRFVAGKSIEASVMNDAASRAIVSWRPGVNGGWLKRAVALCAAGRVPCTPSTPAALQARQLCLALAVDGPLVAMAIEASLARESVDRSRLRSFASAMAWLAHEAAARVLVVVPGSASADPALDAITYGAYRLEAAVNGAAAAAGDAATASTCVWPIVGRPHPSSKGECLLAERLSSDAELRGLFSFNQRVQTVRESSHLVDLVWADGRVVVEVDGWGHETPRNYRGDRHRDYELLISGYLVLRLPHEQVVEDPAIAIEKIRDVVRFRRASPGAGAGEPSRVQGESGCR